MFLGKQKVLFRIANEVFCRPISEVYDIREDRHALLDACYIVNAKGDWVNAMPFKEERRDTYDWEYEKYHAMRVANQKCKECYCTIDHMFPAISGEQFENEDRIVANKNWKVENIAAEYILGGPEKTEDPEGNYQKYVDYYSLMNQAQFKTVIHDSTLNFSDGALLGAYMIAGRTFADDYKGLVLEFDEADPTLVYKLEHLEDLFHEVSLPLFDFKVEKKDAEIIIRDEQSLVANFINRFVNLYKELNPEVILYNTRFREGLLTGLTIVCEDDVHQRNHIFKIATKSQQRYIIDSVELLATSLGVATHKEEFWKNNYLDKVYLCGDFTDNSIEDNKFASQQHLNFEDNIPFLVYGFKGREVENMILPNGLVTRSC